MAFDTTVIDDEAPADDATQPETLETEVPQNEPDDTETAQDDDTDEQGDPDAVDSEQHDAKPKKGAAARIQQLVAEKKAAEAELERVRQESNQPKPNQSTDGAPQAPNIDDFDLDTEEGLEKYFNAQSEYESQKSEWEFDQKLSKREQLKQQKEREEQIVNQFDQRFKANPEFKKNFEQLTTLMQDKPINADPSQLYQGDDLMDLLEEVAASPDLYYEIASLSEPLQYAKFGEIQATIKARKQTNPVNKQTKAPPPPNHTKSNAPINRSDYDKSDDDFLASRGVK